MIEEKIVELEETISELGTALAENFYQMIQLLSVIISSNERFYDGSHSRFVSEKSAEVASSLKMNEESVTEIRLAGLLHDIGKIGFKEAGLFKFPAEMNQRELQQYSLHPEISKEILNKHFGFNSIAEIICQHHEKLDGSGFPNHLKGSQILPGAAIISVVDTYHNIMHKKTRELLSTNKRNSQLVSTSSYLDLSKDRYHIAMNYLTKKKGILFDKKVVDKFIEILEIQRRALGLKSVMRIHVNSIQSDMVFAEDYYSSFGLLIAAKGEKTTNKMRKALVRFADAGEIPYKILVLK